MRQRVKRHELVAILAASPKNRYGPFSYLLSLLLLRVREIKRRRMCHNIEGIFNNVRVKKERNTKRKKVILYGARVISWHRHWHTSTLTQITHIYTYTECVTHVLTTGDATYKHHACIDKCERRVNGWKKYLRSRYKSHFHSLSNMAEDLNSPCSPSKFILGVRNNTTCKKIMKMEGRTIKRCNINKMRICGSIIIEISTLLVSREVSYFLYGKEFILVTHLAIHFIKLRISILLNF